MVSNKRDSYYFDYAVYFLGENGRLSNINYGSQRYNGFNHSGDIGSLLHHVSHSIKPENGQSFVLTVIGYNKKFLRSFHTQVRLYSLLLLGQETKK